MNIAIAGKERQSEQDLFSNIDVFCHLVAASFSFMSLHRFLFLTLLYFDLWLMDELSAVKRTGKKGEHGTEEARKQNHEICSN